MAEPQTACERIAYADHASEVGGAEKSMLDIIERLDRGRFEPLLFCAEDAQWLDGADLDGVTVERVFRPGGLLERSREEVGAGVLSKARDALLASGPVGRLWRRFRHWQPALVHTNTLKAHMLAGAAAHFAHRRLVWHMRDILDEGGALDMLVRAAERFRPKIVAISEAVRASLSAAELDVTVIHNGTDISAFHPRPDREALRADLSLGPEDVAVCVVGRLTPWKGHRELLRAFSEVCKAQTNARLLVVGEVAFWEDDYEGELKGLAADLGIEGQVQWLGFRRDVPEVLAACDVFALASVDEPFGRVYVEAMASGLPAIGTRSGGVPEIVLDGETGLLVPPGDVDALVKALLRLTGDADLRARLGVSGRARAQERFDVDRTAARVQALYEELLEG